MKQRSRRVSSEPLPRGGVRDAGRAQVEPRGRGHHEHGAALNVHCDNGAPGRNVLLGRRAGRGIGPQSGVEQSLHRSLHGRVERQLDAAARSRRAYRFLADDFAVTVAGDLSQSVEAVQMRIVRCFDAAVTDPVARLVVERVGRGGVGGRIGQVRPVECQFRLRLAALQFGFRDGHADPHDVRGERAVVVDAPRQAADAHSRKQPRMAFDLGTHIKRNVFDDRMIVECFAGNDRLVGLAPRRSRKRGRYQIPNAAQASSPQRHRWPVPRRLRFREPPAARRDGLRLARRVAESRPASRSTPLATRRTSLPGVPTRLRGGQAGLFLRGHDGSIATLGPRQAGDCLTSQPLFVGRILEPAVMDADVVALDILGQNSPVAQVNASVGHGDRLNAIGRGLEGGHIFIRQKALQLHEPGRHNGQRHREGDKQPDQPTAPTFVPIGPMQSRVTRRGTAGGEKDIRGAVVHRRQSPPANRPITGAKREPEVRRVVHSNWATSSAAASRIVVATARSAASTATTDTCNSPPTDEWVINCEIAPARNSSVHQPKRRRGHDSLRRPIASEAAAANRQKAATRAPK